MNIKRDRSIYVRLTELEYLSIKGSANYHKMNVSEYVRYASMNMPSKDWMSLIEGLVGVAKSLYITGKVQADGRINYNAL